MPITLPPHLRDEYFDFEVDLEQPAEPPTDLDVVKAMKYEKAVIEAFDIGDGEGGDGNTTPADVAAALVYKASVIAARIPVAATPAWLEAALGQINNRFDTLNNALNATNARLDVINTRLDTTDTKLEEIETTVSRVNHTTAYLFNKTVGNGEIMSFKEVPFPDGTFPTKPPNNLPWIESVTALERMTDEQIMAYHTKYCPTQRRRPTRASQITQILRKIGYV
ncbi:hypothetical protein BDQ12DRAFT_691270 [Crucibulum laeve]|uniref:Mug135-like C-terminal domain-containing protein n=1 Tax=Crucibulum laeve TaxID=68775 RepID=A0A5C3LKQ9_9AGAR|nr:hypothetical protein BDQ12DRAFT_691270 [Crucibulum laeve]